MKFLTDIFFPKWKRSDSKDNNHTDDVILTIKKIKAGDNLLRNDFIDKYKPFILKTISSVTGNYIDTENSDEYSIGLSAFNEAIDCFDESKGVMFFKFCSLVIKRRVSDYIRHNKKHNKVLPFTYFEDGDDNSFEQTHLSATNDDLSTFEFSDEAKSFEKKLNELGIKLEDLVRSAPKHKDSKALCLKIAKAIADNKECFSKLEKTGIIQKSELIKTLKINKKTIERNRIFIIAAALIIGNGFYLLRDFLDIPEVGGKQVGQSKK